MDALLFCLVAVTAFLLVSRPEGPVSREVRICCGRILMCGGGGDMCRGGGARRPAEPRRLAEDGSHHHSSDQFVGGNARAARSTRGDSRTSRRDNRMSSCPVLLSSCPPRLRCVLLRCQKLQEIAFRA